MNILFILTKLLPKTMIRYASLDICDAILLLYLSCMEITLVPLSEVDRSETLMNIFKRRILLLSRK